MLTALQTAHFLAENDRNEKFTGVDSWWIPDVGGQSHVVVDAFPPTDVIELPPVKAVTDNQVPKLLTHTFTPGE